MGLSPGLFRRFFLPAPAGGSRGDSIDRVAIFAQRGLKIFRGAVAIGFFGTVLLG